MPQRSSRLRVKIALACAASAGCLFVACAMDVVSQPGMQAALPDSPVFEYQRSITGGFPGVGQEHIERLVGSQEFALTAPSALSVRGDDLYIYDDAVRVLFRYDLAFDALSEFLSERVLTSLRMAASPVTGIFVASDASVLIADPNNSRVLRFNHLGELITTYSDPLNLSRPNGVLVDASSGNVFVADATYGQIVVFTALGTPIAAINSSVSGTGRFQMIEDMTFGPDGLYVLDRLSKEVYVMGLDGTFRYAFENSEVSNPGAIVVDRFGRVFVSDRQDNTIKIYENGKLTFSYGGAGSGPGQFFDVNDMWLDRDMLYVADTMNARVQVYRIKPPAAMGER